MQRIRMTALDPTQFGKLVRGVSLRQIQALPLRVAIGRMKEAGDLDAIRNLNQEISGTLIALEVEK